MWEFLKSAAENGSLQSVLLFLGVIAVLVAYCGKHGIIKWHTDKVTIGASEAERAVIRQQVEWTELEVQSLARCTWFDDADQWRTKYILERMFDEILQWIIFNHIKDSDSYISIKQEKLWNMTQMLVEKPEFTSDEFKDFVFNETDKIIKRLVQLRKSYITS